MSVFRVIPSIEELLRRPALGAAIETHGGDLVTAAARRAADDLRARLKHGGDPMPASADDAGRWLEARALADLAARLAPSLRRAINATGVIVHTNLGRAPLAAEALARAVEIGRGYSNLEYDLDAGRRGHRHAHAERLLVELTGAEAALVVNNNAAAVLIVLAALAAGRDAIVSRGELVEIGGGFRVPDVMAQSGAVLREVGTTNRTRVNDYAAAIGERTALLLRVHPSNFRIEGFTERPALPELAALARRFDLPLVEDAGSGWLGGNVDTPAVLRDEPSVAGCLAAGADLVTFSGDKLLGGPQAGLIVGRRALIDRVRSHPLMRAVRADKLTYAALEATLSLWAQPAGRTRIPVYRMLTATIDTMERRARAVLEALDAAPELACRVIDGVSTTGGGSAPGSELPTRLIAVRLAGASAAALEARLRAGTPPVIARIQQDDVVLDLRTVDEDEDAAVVAALRQLSAAGRDPATDLRNEASQ
jgi:L-seryl-tRNA(Ser) seleniumtransferase